MSKAIPSIDFGASHNPDAEIRRANDKTLAF